MGVNTAVPAHTSVLIIADIEGSSGCRRYADSQFMSRTWPGACLEMTRDVAAVVTALFDAGAQSVTVKDFHRTAYNILPECIDRRARVVLGYRRTPVPGIGDPGNATALMMIGMHAPSGSGGFLAHTLTSRIAELRVNGRLLTEAELFSASLASFGVSPVFFSGCPVACAAAASAIEHLSVYPIEKSADGFDALTWRKGLAVAAVQALGNSAATPFVPGGPVSAVVTLRDGASAATALAKPWRYCHRGDRLYLEASDLNALYALLIRLCYFTPVTERILPVALPLYNLYGRLGQAWVRHRLRHNGGSRSPRIIVL